MSCALFRRRREEQNRRLVRAGISAFVISAAVGGIFYANATKHETEMSAGAKIVSAGVVLASLSLATYGRNRSPEIPEHKIPNLSTTPAPIPIRRRSAADNG